MIPYTVFCNILLRWFSPMVALVWKSKTCCGYCKQKEYVYQLNCVDSATTVFGFIMGNTAGCHTPRLLCRLFSSSTFFWPNSPALTQGLLVLRARHHTQTHHTRLEFSGLGIDPSQRPLPDNSQHSQETHSHAPEGFGNPQSQQASVCRPTPYRTATGLGLSMELLDEKW
jgi:hypothetical protein